MSHKPMLKILFASIWATTEVSCEVWTHNKAAEVNADTFCSTYDVVNEFLVANQLRCLATCSFPVKCTAIVYNPENRSCARLKNGSQHGGCLQDLSGAKLYKPERCPYGWTFVHTNCYRLTGEGNSTYGESLAICKSFSQSAHLADIKTQTQQQEVHVWAAKQVGRGYYWLGATWDDGWVWSDGTPVEQWNWAEDNPRYTEHQGRYCMAAHVDEPTGYDLPCAEKSLYVPEQGLCELDIL